MLWPSVHSPGWLRMKSQTLPTAGPHAEPTAPGSTSRRYRGQLAGVNSLYVDGDRHSSIINQNRDRVTHCTGRPPVALKGLYRWSLRLATSWRVTALP